MVNTIAIVGHSGLVGKYLTAALAQADVSLRVLHRKGSNTDELDPRIQKLEIDYDDEESIVKALTGVDILLSFLGEQSLSTVQPKLVQPALKAKVKLFVPSELGYAWTPDEEASAGPLRGKTITRQALKEAGVPFLRLMAGGFADLFDYFFGPETIFGVDRKANTINVFGDETKTYTMSTLAFIAAAHIQLFTSPDFESLAGRQVGIYELNPSRADIIKALTAKHGKAPTVTTFSLEDLEAQQKEYLARDNTTAIGKIIFAMKIKTARGTANVGTDIVEVKGYKKKTIEDIIDA